MLVYSHPDTANLSQTYDPTIEDAFRHSVIVDDEMTYLEIVDTAGQGQFILDFPGQFLTVCRGIRHAARPVDPRGRGIHLGILDRLAEVL